MKWVVVVIMMINGQPNTMVLSDKHATLGQCNYEMMRWVFQLHTASWKISCVQVEDK